ncbi:MAG: DNA-directed RNA polymerase subunit K [Nanoarchaeota archaeon]|nr:DNA-directed RNA polymerase subunit K [Nanoarchaeota archaeon]
MIKVETKSLEDQFSKYEIARILGARGLQIAMNAPLLIKMSKEDLELVNYDALKIAEVELESGVLPISVKRPFPQKRGDKLKRVKEREVSEEKIEKKKSEEEQEISKEGEIMGLVNPDDEMETDSDNESGGEE